MRKILTTLSTRFSTLGELFVYLWRERLWWLIPFVLVLVIVGAMIILAQASPVMPFLYTAF